MMMTDGMRTNSQNGILMNQSNKRSWLQQPLRLVSPLVVLLTLLTVTPLGAQPADSCGDSSWHNCV